MGTPNVYPMVVTFYNLENVWNGYTLFPVSGVGCVLLDINGNVIRTWKNFKGQPDKLLLGRFVMGSLATRD